MYNVLFQITKKPGLMIVSVILIALLFISFLLSDVQSAIQDYNRGKDTAVSYANQDIEGYARLQARNMAKGIGECINGFVAISGTPTEKDLIKIVYNCGASHRSGGPTGDMFVVDITNKKFLYDGSPDCAKGGEGRPLSYYGECSMHKDKEQCQKVIIEMYKTYNTTPESKQWWNFDGSAEWLEWYIIPTERSGFLGPIGVYGEKSIANRQLMIVMGTQKDEVYPQYNLSFKFFHEMFDIVDFCLNKLGYTVYIFAICVIILAILYGWRERQCFTCPNRNSQKL